MAEVTEERWLAVQCVNPNCRQWIGISAISPQMSLEQALPPIGPEPSLLNCSGCGWSLYVSRADLRILRRQVPRAE